VRVWSALDDVALDQGDRSFVTVGNFDGVHRGHQALLAGLVSAAREAGAGSVVTTFEPHPMTVIHPDSAPHRLATLEHRLQLLQGQHVDAVLVLPFTRELSLWSADEFVRHVLVETLHAAEVRVGENFRYGHRAAGDVHTLATSGAQLGFDVVALPLVGDGSRWSSTYIRQCLAEGDVATAAAALGRPHRLEGLVVEGDKRGRELGYPTANLGDTQGYAVPADGIYAGWLVRASGERLPAAISIGTNPTFDGTGLRVEAYVLDRDDLELYGEHVALDFLARLRETVRFDGIDALLVQMAEDVRRARELTATT
jgi:riboflavin kinase / FMN adenylyltransferase